MFPFTKTKVPTFGAPAPKEEVSRQDLQRFLKRGTPEKVLELYHSGKLSHLIEGPASKKFSLTFKTGATVHIWSDSAIVSNDKNFIVFKQNYHEVFRAAQSEVQNYGLPHE